MTDFTPARLAELRAVAEAATPGPWEPKTRRGGDFQEVTLADVIVWSGSGQSSEGRWIDSPDIDHIAAFDPPTVLALIAALEAKTAEVDDLAADPGHKAAKYWKWWQREKARADRAEAALERVRALHRKAHAIFSWSEGGVRYEEPCENCNGAPGVHDCGCWADEQVEYVCAECDRGKGKHRDSGWPCPTVQAIEGADDA